VLDKQTVDMVREKLELDLPPGLNEIAGLAA